MSKRAGRNPAPALGCAAMGERGSESGIRIVEATGVDDALVSVMARLVPQLSRSNSPPDAATLEAIVGSEASALLLALDEEGAVVGSLTLALFRIPTGLRAWIEDVVVDEAARGRGVGEALNREAIGRARAEGATTVDLTSRPSREAANRLYRRLGFEERATNVYRLAL